MKRYYIIPEEEVKKLTKKQIVNVFSDTEDIGELLLSPVELHDFRRVAQAQVDFILSKGKLVDLDEAETMYSLLVKCDDVELCTNYHNCRSCDKTKKFSEYLEAQQKEWWLEKDCKKCEHYPDCEFIETKSDKPRACSLLREAQHDIK